MTSEERDEIKAIVREVIQEDGVLINDNQAFPVVSDPGDGALTWYMRGNGSDADVFGRTPFTGGGGGGTGEVTVSTLSAAIYVQRQNTVRITVSTDVTAQQVVLYRGTVSVGNSSESGTSWTFRDTFTPITLGSVVYRAVATINGVEKEGTATVTVQKQPTELSWSQSSYNATIGGSNTFPTLSGATGLTITYSSSNQSVATINSSGVVTLVGAGSCTITASYAGDEIHQAATATYTLNVSEQRLTVQIGHGTSYATAQFTDTGEQLVAGLHLSQAVSKNDYLFLKIDKRQNISLVTTDNDDPTFNSEIPFDNAVVDGDYKYYKKTDAYPRAITARILIVRI